MTREEALEAAPKADLAAVFADGAVVHEQKVRVAVVEVEAAARVDRPIVVPIVGHLNLLFIIIIIIVFC